MSENTEAATLVINTWCQRPMETSLSAVDDAEPKGH